MPQDMGEHIKLGTNPLGYHPPERIYEPQYGIAPLGFREAVCRAAAWDAGNRSMRDARRTAWSVEDFNAATREYERLIEQ